MKLSLVSALVRRVLRPTFLHPQQCRLPLRCSRRECSIIMCEPRKIQTLVFLDLETTGLLHNEWGRTRITELSLCAARIHDLQKTFNGLPRVINKLSLCLNPQKVIDIKASEVTGLTNELLEYYGGFDANVFHMVEQFLERLPQPVCLLAHNGNRFDFPVLHSELRHIEKKLHDEVLCADTLVAFRQLYGVNNVRKQLFSPKVPTALGSPSRGSMEVDGIKPLDISPKNNGIAGISLAAVAISATENGLAAAHSFGEPSTSSGTSSQAPPVSVTVGYPPARWDEFDDDLMELAERLERQYYSPKQQTGPELPPPQPRPRAQVANEMTPPRPQPLSMQQINETTPDRPIVPRQEPFFNVRPKSFKLGDVYEHVMQSPVPANMHSAEADCLALMQCAVRLSPQFIDWVQANAVPFNQLD